MDYNLKIVINGVEVLEGTGEVDVSGVTYDIPSITNVMLQNSASFGPMDIGATASDKLTFTMLHPYKQSFDGSVVEFWIEENLDNAESTISRIAGEVGSDTASESIDTTRNTSNLIEDEEEGEELTDEELADVLEVQDLNQEDLFVQLEGEDDETEAEEIVGAGWQKMGIYYVMGQVNNPDGSVNITAYDGFSQLNDFYNPTNITGTVQSMFDELRASVLEDCNIEIAEFDFDDIAEEVVTLSVLTTYRGALGYFAGLVGGFVEFDEDGVAHISFYSFSSNDLIMSELLSYSEDSAGEMILQELTCNPVINGTEEITVGAGQGLSFTNPMMSESMLEKVLATYNGMRFVGGSISAIWDTSLIAGRFIRIFTEDEYANYLAILNKIKITTDETELMNLKTNINSLGSIMLIGSQLIDFRGNATTRIISGNSTEASKLNALTPPLIQKVMEAGRTATNYLSQDPSGALVVASLLDGGNVRIDSDSVDIRNEEEVLASFGERTIIGDEAGNHIELTDEAMTMAYGKSPMFKAEFVANTTIETIPRASVTNSTYQGQACSTFTLPSGTSIKEIIGVINLSRATGKNFYFDGSRVYVVPAYTDADWIVSYLDKTPVYASALQIKYIGSGASGVASEVSIAGDLIIDNNPVVDYVIEESRSTISGSGVNGQWNIRKWASGLAECWADGVASKAHYTTVFGGYAYFLEINYPTGLFVSKPIYHDGQMQVGTGFSLMSGNISATTNTKTALYCVANQSGTREIYFRAYTLGRWK